MKKKKKLFSFVWTQNFDLKYRRFTRLELEEEDTIKRHSYYKHKAINYKYI